MKGTKLAALFVLALFVVGMAPFAFAEGQQGAGDGQGQPEVQPETTSAQPEQVSAGGTQLSAYEQSRQERIAQAEQIKAELMQKREVARIEMQAGKETLRARYEKARLQFQQRNEERKQLYQQFKEKRQEIKAEREAAREEIGKVREKIRECKADDSEDCKQARTTAKVQSGKFLTKASEHIIGLLERARERIQNSGLSEEIKTQRLAEIDAAIADADSTLAGVEGIDETATKADLKEGALLVRDAWAKAKKAVKNAVGVVASQRVGGIIVKMEHLGERFEKAIAKLEQNGKDVGAAKAKQAEYQSRLEAANALQVEAQNRFEAGDHDAAAEKIRAAHAELKAAHETLKGMVQEVRGIGGAKELEAEETTNE